MRSGGRWWRLVLLAAFVVCPAAVACSGESAGSTLRVVLDADALQCEGTRVRTVDVWRYDHDFTTPALEIRRGMHCTLEFHVINAGDSDVVLDTATVAGVGPGAGAGVRAAELTPLGAKPRQDDGTAAVFSMDSYRLEAGDAEEFAVVLEYRRGCTPPSANINFSESPAITTEDGSVATPFGPAYAFVGTQDSICDQ